MTKRHLVSFPEPTPRKPVETQVSVIEKRWDIKLLGAARQAVTAACTTVALDARKPVTGIFKHLIAVFAEVRHLVSCSKVPQAQNFRNVDVFWAR